VANARLSGTGRRQLNLFKPHDFRAAVRMNADSFDHGRLWKGALAADGSAQFTGPEPPMSSAVGSEGFTPVARLMNTVITHSTTPMPISTPAILY
jgi:hypothetical protein